MQRIAKSMLNIKSKETANPRLLILKNNQISERI
jgi:hypothetical protein